LLYHAHPPLVILAAAWRERVRLPVHRDHFIGIIAIGIDAVIDPLILLHHKVCGRMCLAVEAAQHGHRGNLRTRIAISRRRTVAIEFGMCRSGRRGGASWSVTVG
jgi:hypothetical protein